MAKIGRYVQEGKVIDIVATADVVGGEPVDFGTRVGIASFDAVTGEDVSLQLEGVFEFTATNADVIALGDKIYLDNVGGILATTTATSNQTIGYATTEKAGTTDGVVLVKLGV